MSREIAVVGVAARLGWPQAIRYGSVGLGRRRHREAAAPAVIAAIENALEEFKVEINFYPISPKQLTELINQPHSTAA